jgi:hypothetical protein
MRKKIIEVLEKIQVLREAPSGKNLEVWLFSDCHVAYVTYGSSTFTQSKVAIMGISSKDEAVIPILPSVRP